MASVDEVKRLAALSRITVREDELAKLSKEFESILAYIGQIEKLQVDPSAKKLPRVHNVFREDGEPHPSGAYTAELAAQFPEREGDSLKVKQIISND